MAFLQSDPPHQPMFRAPPVILWLIAALAALHAARVLQPPGRAEAIIDEYAFNPARYSAAYLTARHIDPGTLWERALPFVTYMGLHNDLTHLGINCLFLLAFGPIVARRFGTPIGFDAELRPVDVREELDGKRVQRKYAEEDCHGHANCHRISIASIPPSMKKVREVKRNWMPMVL